MARLMLSVAPEVKRISRGDAPMRVARCCLAVLTCAAARIAVGVVDATGVPEVVGEAVGHHVDDAGVNGGGSVVVEVDGRHG